MSMELSREHTCCFTGHRPEKLPWRSDETAPACVTLKQRIVKRLEELYAKGYRHFLTGMARGTDLYFAEAVLDLRERLPNVSLEAAVPCPTQAKGWTEEEQDRYHSILDRCDLVSMVQQHYDKGCMFRRNRYMVDRSSLLVAVYDGQPGGTRYTINYAMDNGVEVVMMSV